ncbi:hypothetical protein [Nocardia sp. NBC_01329]|uniref:hypothetical protein n=1 Tax=Nocardia sp. NBC_01329 TaxID=2903594 RepID=UPI002E12FF22|nr:hypothetical protein OG405_07795 [Nocardia sp. NBC_01329]
MLDISGLTARFGGITALDDVGFTALEGVSSFLEKRPARYPDSVARDIPEIFGADLPVPPLRP